MWKVRSDHLALFQHDLQIFFSELKRKRRNKNHLLSRFVNTLEIGGMELTVFTSEIVEKHTFNHNYVANPTVNTQINLVTILKFLRIPHPPY